MTVKYSVEVRNAKLDAWENTIGAAAILEMRSGSPPANITDAATGTLLAQAALPSDWMNAASAGSKTKAGTWTLTGLAAGTLGYYRIYESGSPSKAHEQGTITATGGGGDMEVDNTSVAVSQTITVTTFTKTGGNA